MLKSDVIHPVNLELSVLRSLTLSGPGVGVGGSEARMTKLTPASQKLLIL